MKPLRPARRRHESGLPALDLLEEAWHALRTAPASAHAAWAAGTVPFAIALLYFIGDMNRGADARERLLSGSLLLAVAFVWMKTWQAEFARRVRAALSVRPPPPLSARRLLAVARNQAALQPWGLPVLAFSALCVIPLPWTLAYYQSLSALDDGDKPPGALHAAAWRQAARWPYPNITLLAFLAPFAFFVWANILLLMLMLPGLLKSFLGIDTPFTILRGWDGLKLIFNATFFSVQLTLAWLALDPLLKAVYVVRCWHGEALESGEDLRAVIAELRAPREAAA